MSKRIPRREAIQRLVAAGAVLAGGGALAKFRYDPGGESAEDRGARQIRDFRISGRPELPQMAIAKSSQDPAALTRRAVEALGGMARFVSRGDVVAVKPNIGWDRMPVHAANTNPQVVAAVVKLAFDAGARRVVVFTISRSSAARAPRSIKESTAL